MKTSLKRQQTSNFLMTNDWQKELQRDMKGLLRIMSMCATLTESSLKGI